MRWWAGASARRAVVPAALGLVIALGVGDYVTGVDIPFTMLYVVPIALATWVHGRGFGAIVAALATAGTAGSILSVPSLGWLALAWNTTGAIGIFAGEVVLVELARRAVEREREARRVTIEQLRHAERLGVIGALAAGVAHELGTPLGVITGAAEMLEADGPDAARARELGHVIGAQAARMSAIIQHLLDFGRRGGGGGGRVAVDLREVARAAVELTASAVRKRRCHVDLVGDAAVIARANPAELEQVASNLILNAAQATPGGGPVTVTVRDEVRPDAAGAARRWAALVVEDRGAGIAPADLPRIFDPFFTTKGVGEGTGLGLSVSYGIVRDHGGAIEVASEVGKGARFTVLVPADGD